MTIRTVVQENDDIRVLRDSGAGKRPLSLLDELFVERGTNEDWKIVHELHYKSGNLGIGPRFMRCALKDGTDHGQTIGVIVFTVPKPLDSGRNIVFPHMKPNQNGKDDTLVNRMRMMWLNNNVVLSSRVVLDTMYRGAGVAYRFRNIASRMMGYRYVEARSSMSRFNPFALKAGAKFVAPKSAPALEAGLQFFRRHFVSPAYDSVAIIAELKSMPAVVREKVLEELRAFYYRHSSMEKSGENRLNGTSRVEQMAIGYLLKQTQQLIFGQTVYAIWTNPDFDTTTQKMRDLPKRLPLSAFDLQGPNDPLRLDLLKEIQS